MSDDNKKLEIVSGNADDLDISPVYQHLKNSKPKTNNKPKNVVIPRSKSDDSKDDEEEISD